MFESCATNQNGSWHRIVAVLMQRLAVKTVRIDIDELQEIEHLQIDSRIHEGQLVIRLHPPQRIGPKLQQLIDEEPNDQARNEDPPAQPPEQTNGAT